MVVVVVVLVVILTSGECIWLILKRSPMMVVYQKAIVRGSIAYKQCLHIETTVKLHQKFEKKKNILFV